MPLHDPKRCTIIALLTILLIRTALAQPILNEIMYNPSGPENATEYIELFNPTQKLVELQGWSISDGTGTDTLVMFDTTGFPVLPPGGYTLILDPDYPEDGEGLYDPFIPSETLLLTVPDAALGSAGLSNSNPETVQLIAPNGEVISSRRYRIGAEQGSSEERIQPGGGEGDDNWQFSPPGGTPGYRNAATPPPVDWAVDSLRLSYAPRRDSLRHAYIAWAVTVHNRGSLDAPQTPLLLEFGDGTLESVHPIRPLAAGDSANLADTTAALDIGGTYTLVARLRDGDENPLNDADTATVTLPYQPGQVQIAEIMADPPDTLAVEWLELTAHDRSFAGIELEGWTLVDAAGTEGTLGSFRTAPAGDSTLAVIAPDSLPLADPVAWSHVSSWPNLNNDGDSLLLVDPTGRVIDAVVYDDAPDGRSLYRTRWVQPPLARDWLPTIGPSGSTPGKPPQSSGDHPVEPDAGAVGVVVEPNPIHPVEGTLFRFQFPVQQVELTLRLYDVNGRELGTLLDSQPFPAWGEFHWDGRAGLRRALPAGIYVWLLDARAVGDAGEWKRKGTVVSPGL